MFRFIRIYLFIIILLNVVTGCSLHTSHYCGEFPAQNLKHLNPHYVAVKNGQMEYYRFGQGSPLVLIPGYVTDVTSWNQKFLLYLAEQHELIVLNNRQVGGSIVLSSQYTSKALAQDTIQLIQSLKLRKPAILGMSMGGMIAQKLAVMYPSKISRLILINTAVAGKTAMHPQAIIEKNMLNMPNDKLGRYFLALKLFFPPSWRVQMGFTLIRDRFLPEHYTEIKPDSVKSLQQQLITAWLQDESTAEKLKNLTLPVLILNGRSDQIIPPINSDILVKTLPKARLVTWQEGGHAMIYQYPQEMADHINHFLQQSVLG